MKRKKKGISLIVLIITIIIVIILAAVVIITISKNNPINSAREARFKEDIRNFQSELSMYIGNQIVKDYSGTREKITTTDSSTFDEMKEYILSFQEKYEGKLGIEKDELVYFPKKITEEEEKWLIDLGIKKAGYTILEAQEDMFSWDVNKIRITGIINQEKFEEYLNKNKNILKIPEKCVEIGKYAFREQPLIHSVVMHDNIVSIGEYSFYADDNIESVKCSDKIKTIPNHAFSNCRSLKKFELPPNLYSIEMNAFFYCENLEEINIPNGVTEIGNYAFAQCNNLKQVNIPSSVISVSKGSFSGFSMENINVEESNPNYSSIDGVLFNKDKTTLITFPRGKQIDKYVIPSTVTNINGAFNEIQNLKSVVISGGITSINTYTFLSCPKLSSVIIPSTVTDIGEQAFYNCFQLIINCEVESKPNTWNDKWYGGIKEVVWNYKGE